MPKKSKTCPDCRQPVRPPDPPRAATPICRDIDGIQGEHDWQPALSAHARILDADRLMGVITVSRICAHCGMTRTLDTRADGGQRTAYRDADGLLVNEQVRNPMATAPRRCQSPIPRALTRRIS